MIETLRTVFRVFIPKGQRTKLVGLIALALAVAGAETLTALLIFRVLSFATDPTDYAESIVLPFGVETTIVPLLIAAAFAFVVRGFLSISNTYAQARVVQGAGAAVSAEVHRRYLQAPYRFHLSRSSSESVRTVLWSVDQATQNALKPLITIVTQSLIAAALITLLISIAPTLTLATVVVLVSGLGLVLALVQPRLGRLGRLSESTVQALLASVRDSFDSVRDIKAYRAESHFDQRFAFHRDVLAGVRVHQSTVPRESSSLVSRSKKAFSAATLLPPWVVSTLAHSSGWVSSMKANNSTVSSPRTGSKSVDWVPSFHAV